MSRISLALVSASIFCARGGELRVDFAELLGRQRGVVVADKQIGLGAEVLDLGLGVFHFLAHRIDLAGKPLSGALGLVLLGLALAYQIAIGDGVGGPRGEVGV